MLPGVDHEGAWSVMYPGSCPGPGNMALGATGRPEHARAMYGVIGAELRALGLHVVFVGDDHTLEAELTAQHVAEDGIRELNSQVLE